MTAQTPGCGSNSEARKRREHAVDPHAGCTPGTCRTDEQWRTVSCAPTAVVPDDLPEIGLLRPGQLWVIPGPGPVAAELERFHQIGQSRRDEISDEDWAWFCAHRLTDFPRIQWGEVIPVLLEWIRARGGEGDGQPAAPQPTEGGARMTYAEQRDIQAAFERDKWAGEWNSLPTAIDRLLAARSQRPEGAREPLSTPVERGVECFHGTPGSCEALRCGSNCSNRFDRMHPCPACLIVEIRDLRDKVTALGGDPYAPRRPQHPEALYLTTAPTLSSLETFAVAVLDDGSEVRMRNFGDRVEVRSWDKTASCKPPALVVSRIGAHVIDARPAEVSGDTEAGGGA